MDGDFIYEFISIILLNGYSKYYFKLFFLYLLINIVYRFDQKIFFVQWILFNLESYNQFKYIEYVFVECLVIYGIFILFFIYNVQGLF